MRYLGPFLTFEMAGGKAGQAELPDFLEFLPSSSFPESSIVGSENHPGDQSQQPD